MTRMIATLFGVGLSPVAPGTVGSAVAAVLGILVISLGGMWLLLSVAFFTFWLGLWATDVMTAGSDNHDPSEIVIDEVVGQFLALVPLSAGLSPFMNGEGIKNWGAILLAFILFRAFDIIKPFPVNWADRMNTPRGVMLDDVLAGLMALVVILVLNYFIA